MKALSSVVFIWMIARLDDTFIDSANVPPEVAVTLGRQTFQMLKAKQDPSVKALYPFAGEKAGAPEHVSPSVP